MAAVTKIRNPGTEGRIYFERKVAERQDLEGGASLDQASGEQLGLPRAAPRHPTGGPGGHPETTQCQRDRLYTLARPALRRSHSRTHRNPTPSCSSVTARFVAPGITGNRGLDSKRIRRVAPTPGANETPSARLTDARYGDEGIPQLRTPSIWRGRDLGGAEFWVFVQWRFGDVLRTRWQRGTRQLLFSSRVPRLGLSSVPSQRVYGWRTILTAPSSFFWKIS